MARFVVDIGDVHMSKEALLELNKAIQSTALAHIGRHAGTDLIVTKFPKDWWGLIAYPDLGPLLDIEKTLGRNVLGLK